MMDDFEKRKKELGIPEPPPAVRLLLSKIMPDQVRPPEEPSPESPQPPILPQGGAFSRLLAASFVIPIIFMVLRGTNVTLASESLASKLIAYVAIFWPVAAPNYTAIKVLAGEATAINYAVFLAVAFAFLGVCALFAFKEFFSRPKGESPSIIYAVLLAPIFIGIYFGAQYLNVVQPVRKSRIDFFIDSYGIYYLQQYFLILCGSLFVFILLYIVQRIFGYITQTSQS